MQRNLFSFSYADDISIGDEVLVYRNNELNPNKIINMSNIIVEGDWF